MICSVVGCTSPSRARQYCWAHYHRLRTHGDPTLGGPPRGYVQDYFESIVLPYQGDECLIWPFARSHGYAVIGVKRKARSVCRIICERIHGEPPSPEHHAAHSCGNGDAGCVAQTHLSWKTPSDNQADRISHNTHCRGERQWMAKLTAQEVVEITKQSRTRSQRAIAVDFGVSKGTISHIMRGANWSWLTGLGE